MSATQVKPALYRLEGYMATFIARWHWVKLAELAKMIGLTPMQVLRRYEQLVRPTKDLNLRHASVELHWVVEHMRGVACCGEHHELWQERPLDELDYLYVPAGWAQDVIEVVRYGMHHVCREEFDLYDRIPHGALLIYKNPERRGSRIAVVGLDAHGGVQGRNEDWGRVLLR